MVMKPFYRLLANGDDVTQKLSRYTISIEYVDKKNEESDEISLKLHGLYTKPLFGDSLELWLGMGSEEWHCGKFSVQTCSRDFKNHTTEVRATAVNFASPQKEKKTRTWENTTLEGIASKIAGEHGLAVKSSGASAVQIASVLQENKNDMDFLYGLAFEYGFVAMVKNGTIVIAPQDGKIDGESISGNGSAVPSFTFALNELFELEVTDANRNVYGAVIMEWHSATEGKTKSIKVGDGQEFKALIAEPKNDAEAYKKAEAKLGELQRGGINGRCKSAGKEVRAGGKISFTGVEDIEGIEFIIKSVTHHLDTHAYIVDIEFEGNEDTQK